MLGCAASLNQERAETPSEMTAPAEQVEPAPEVEPAETLPKGGYLKVYGLQFATAATSDGYEQGAFHISNRPERTSGEPVYRCELELGHQGKWLVFKANLVGEDGSLRLRDWNVEGGTLSEDQVARWHAHAAAQAGAR